MNNCINCNKKLVDYRSIRCSSCAAKFFLTGKSLQERNHKIDCHCGVCKAVRGETKGIKKSEETKKKMKEVTRQSLTEEHKEAIRNSYYHTHRDGKNNWNYGRKRELSPVWQGGISFDPYSIEWTSELREFIRNRDNHTCQNCNITEEEHIIVFGRTLHVHHIDYNKQNCQKDNLITLCISCNIRANYDREYWKIFYQNKIIIIQKEIIPNGRI